MEKEKFAQFTLRTPDQVIQFDDDVQEFRVGPDGTLTLESAEGYAGFAPGQWLSFQATRS